MRRWISTIATASIKKRNAVGIPNLLSLVQERDQQRAVEAQKASTAQAREAEAHDARRLARSRLRERLSPLSSAIVDHIDEFDEQRDQDHRDRLCESARLAPEHFVAPLVKYIFDLTEKEPWFTEAGLTILDHVKADPARTARLALARMGKTWPIDTHAHILLSRIEHIDPAHIPDALPPIIQLANPHDEFPFGQERERPAKPELLQALWATYPEAVREGVDRLLSSRHYHNVELAARGLLAVHARDPAVLKPLYRSIVSKFSRAELLLDHFDVYRSSFRFLRDALVAAFEDSPDAIDALIQEYIGASDKRSKAQAFKIYQAALRYRQDEAPVPPSSRVHRVAFQRLLWAATTEESEEVLRSAQEMLRGRPYQMVDIARAEIDGLIGAVLPLDDRLRRHDETPAPEGEIFLQALERSNRRSTIISLMKSLIEWASIAAKDDPALMRKVAALFDEIPEGRNHLKGVALGCIEHLSGTVEGFKLVLPHLYYGLVGPSALVRAYAAEALGEMPHDNIPLLVYEAYSALLLDPFVVVHQAAVQALGRFSRRTAASPLSVRVNGLSRGMKPQKIFPLTRTAALGFAGDAATGSELIQELFRQLRHGRSIDPVSMNLWLPRFFRSAYSELQKKGQAGRVDFMVGSVVPGRLDVIERQRAADLLKEIAFGNPSMQRRFVPDVLMRIMMTDPAHTMVPIANSIAGALCTMTSPQFKPSYIRPLEFAAIGSGERATIEIRRSADWLLAGLPGNDFVESQALTSAVSQFVAEHQIQDVGGMYPCAKLDHRGPICLGAHHRYPLYEVSLTVDPHTGRWIQQNHTTGKRIELPPHADRHRRRPRHERCRR
jgi:hypothetical protein